MNKKLKKILATISAVAMCATSVVSMNVGATAFQDIDGIIYEEFTKFGDSNGLIAIIDDEICGYELKVATRGEVTYISTVWLDFQCYAQLNSEKANELSEFLAENYPFIVTDVTEYESEYSCVTLDYQKELSYEEKFQIAVDIYKNVNLKCGGLILDNPCTQVTELKTLLPEPTLTGDANDDGEINMADAVLIMQTLCNPNEYKLTPQGIANADMDGDGVTAMDALKIQEMIINQ